MDGQGTGDRRMHEGDKPGLTEERGHERHEEPLAETDRIGTDQEETDTGHEAERDVVESILDEAHDRAG